MAHGRAELVRAGFDAWRRGDFSALERLLGPGATWHAVEPGPWDCESRDDVLRTLRERYEQGFGRGEYELVDAARDAVVLVTHPRAVAGGDWPEETAMVVRFRGDAVVSMRDYGSRDEALAAVQAG